MHVLFKKQFIPPCSSFTTPAHSALYKFNSLGEGINNPSLVRQPLTLPAVNGATPFFPGMGLDTLETVFEYYASAQGYGPRIITSGYRDPLANAVLRTPGSKSGSSSNSRHMFGDAVDLHNEHYVMGPPNTNGSCNGQKAAIAEWEAMWSAALSAGVSIVEDKSVSAYCHLHADWRNQGGPFQQ